MASDDSAAAQPNPGKPGAEIGTEQEKQGGEVAPEAAQQQQSDVNDARTTSPPRPLPPTHEETQKGGQGQSSTAVRFQPGLLPGPHPQALMPQTYGRYNPREDIDEVPYEIPHNPRWHKVKIGLMLVAVAFSAAIIGLSVATGYISTGDYGRYYIHQSAYITGVSASAAVLSLVFVVLEMLNICLSKDGLGMHPGWLVTFNLIIGILSAAGFGIMVYYLNDATARYGWRRYFEDQGLADKELALFKGLLAVDFLLFFLHLILFLGACAEANQRSRARMRLQIVEIPYDPSQPLPPGFQYATAPHPNLQYPPTAQQAAAMRHGGWVPSPQPQRVSVHGVIPYITPEQAAQYGGYYSPMPTPAPPQQTRPGPGGYYAPAPHNPFVKNAPAPAAAPKRSSMRGARATAATASGSGQGEAQTAAAAAAVAAGKTKQASNAGKKREAPLPEIPLPEVPAEEEEATAVQEQGKAKEVVSEKAVKKEEEGVAEKAESREPYQEGSVDEKGEPAKPASEEVVSEKGEPAKPASEEVVSEKSEPAKPASEEVVSEKGEPAKPAPEEVVSEKGVSEKDVPGK
ncbi:hypothetical protein QBC41DRAFT_41210 [Cercophora samala]|uniref:Uncharacterized protein n=1 Tax=Cercophora samala TaxID=330535 RepID=A0AA40D2D0_9PEZI|nr:hypothetical protein QBC41DRAFT_41210 [Cercophora samala]